MIEADLTCIAGKSGCAFMCQFSLPLSHELPGQYRARARVMWTSQLSNKRRILWVHRTWTASVPLRRSDVTLGKSLLFRAAFEGNVSSTMCCPKSATRCNGQTHAHQPRSTLYAPPQGHDHPSLMVQGFADEELKEANPCSAMDGLRGTDGDAMVYVRCPKTMPQILESMVIRTAVIPRRQNTKIRHAKCPALAK